MIENIELRLGVEAHKYIYEEFDITETRRDGEYFIVKIAAAPEYKIVNYILNEGGDAKLLNHPELAAVVIKRAKKAIKVHEEPQN